MTETKIERFYLNENEVLIALVRFLYQTNRMSDPNSNFWTVTIEKRDGHVVAVIDLKEVVTLDEKLRALHDESLDGGRWWAHPGDEFSIEILRLLRAAAAIGAEEAVRHAHAQCEERYARARAEAYEDAASIVDRHIAFNSREVARLIRAAAGRARREP